MRIYLREKQIMRSSPQISTQSSTGFCGPTGGLSLMQTPILSLPWLQKSAHLQISFLPRNSAPPELTSSADLHHLQMSDFLASLACLLVLGRDAGLPQATVSHQEAEKLSIYSSEGYIHCRNFLLAALFFRTLGTLFPVFSLPRFLSRSWL